MATNIDDPSYLRDKGLEYLQKGKDYFNKNQQTEHREKGYEVYKKGLDFIIKYLKTETNQNIANKVKDNLKVWIQEAKTMEATLFQNNQKQQNSYPNQPMSINQSKNQQSFPSFPNNPSNGYPQSSQNYQGNQNQTSKKDSPKYTELLH